MSSDVSVEGLENYPFGSYFEIVFVYEQMVITLARYTQRNLNVHGTLFPAKIDGMDVGIACM